MRFRSHQSWFPKEIDLPNDYEDASARSEKTGRAVIADGVSSAIFSRTWARLLTRTAVVNPPLVTDDAALMAWVGDLQKLWREGINFKALPWNLKPKATSTGAQATLLLIEIEPISSAKDGVIADSVEPTAAQSMDDHEAVHPAEYRLQAHALGDCSLFVIRDGRMIRSFPMTDAAAFANPPDIFSSIAKSVAYAAKFQHLDDLCREGDLLVACTDAIGLWAMQEYEAGRQVDWMRYWGNDEAWQADIQYHRALPAGDPRRMRIDDCTLLLLRVVAETIDASEPDMQPDRSDEPFVLIATVRPVASVETAEQTSASVVPGVGEGDGAADAAVADAAAPEASADSSSGMVADGGPVGGIVEQSASVGESAALAEPDAATSASVPEPSPQLTTESTACIEVPVAVDEVLTGHVPPPSNPTAAVAPLSPAADPAHDVESTSAEHGDEASPPSARSRNWFSRLFSN